MHPHLKRRQIVAAIALTLLAAPSIWLARQYRQVNLDRALIAVIKASDPSKVDILLAAGANPSTRDAPEKKQSVMETMKDLIHPKSNHAPTATMVALGYGNVTGGLPPRATHIVKSLINRGADVNALADDGGTALFMSASTGNADTTNAIIAAGADVNHRDNRGSTALIAATLGDNTGTLKALIAARAEIDAKNKYGETAIIVAGTMGYDDTARILVGAGADLNVKDNEGKTALMWAEAANGLAVAAILRKAGARK
jgi:hypothetical protein